MQGRPASYRGNSLTWQYGRLTNLNGTANVFSYNANGIRTKKVSAGTTYQYYLENDKIVRETRSGTQSCDIFYLYGLDGIAGFTHKTGSTTKNYYYRKNMLGDIIAVFGDDGIKYAGYAYDAWGNCTVLQNTNGVAELNPFIYKLRTLKINKKLKKHSKKQYKVI